MHAGQPLIARAQRGHVQKRKRERAVEEVVAREVFAADDGEHERHEGHLEERAHDPRQAGTLGPVGVQARAGEQQHRQQIGEGQDAFGFVQRLTDIHAAQHGGLQDQRGEDGQGHAHEVQRQQRDHPREPAGCGHAQQKRQRRRALAAHVVIGVRLARRGLRQHRLPPAATLTAMSPVPAWTAERTRAQATRAGVDGVDVRVTRGPISLLTTSQGRRCSGRPPDR